VADTRVYTRSSLGSILYLVIGLIITISQGYWHVDHWDGHFWSSLLTAVAATLLWPISIFFNFVLTRR
jgi:hypothetical protein